MALRFYYSNINEKVDVFLRITERLINEYFPDALFRCGIKTLENRREIICTNLVKDMIDPLHKLHDLFPFTVNRIRGRETRLNGDRIYNFKCRTESFKNSPIVFALQ